MGLSDFGLMTLIPSNRKWLFLFKTLALWSWEKSRVQEIVASNPSTKSWRDIIANIFLVKIVLLAWNRQKNEKEAGHDRLLKSEKKGGTEKKNEGQRPKDPKIKTTVSPVSCRQVGRFDT